MTLHWCIFFQQSHYPVRFSQFMGVSNGMNVAATDENGRLTSSSDFDPSSSEQSADTVIYVGNCEETDGEHPPVCIPSLNSVDNRGVLSKVLRESVTDGLVRGCRSVPASPRKLAKTCDKINWAKQSVPTTPVATKKHRSSELSGGFHSAHSSPVRTVGRGPVESNLSSEERWIDGPRISKSKIAEARNVHSNLTRKDGQRLISKREMWVDGPMKNGDADPVYGFMDGHKKNMIRQWVENQSLQLRDRLMKKDHQGDERIRQYKPLTVFKTCDDVGETNLFDGCSRGRASGEEEDKVEESGFTENLFSSSHLQLQESHRRK